MNWLEVFGCFTIASAAAVFAFLVIGAIVTPYCGEKAAAPPPELPAPSPAGPCRDADTFRLRLAIWSAANARPDHKLSVSAEALAAIPKSGRIRMYETDRGDLVIEAYDWGSGLN